ncbi:MAG: methyl-accepting chemotaxis protein [Colwellia sp.]
MKMTIGLKMGGCFFLTLVVLILSSSYALNGVINISSALKNIAGDAWLSAESSSSLNLNVNQGVGLLRSNLLYQEQISEPELEKIDRHLDTSVNALDKLKNSSYATKTQKLAATLVNLNQLKNAVVRRHSEYINALQDSVIVTQKLEKQMHLLGLFGNFQISALEEAFQLEKVTSWSGDIEDKWEFVIAIYSSRVALGEAVSALQTQMTSSNPDAQQENVNDSLIELSDTISDITTSSLASGEISNGEWSGMTYADATSQLLSQYLQATEQVQTKQSVFLAARDELLLLSSELENKANELSSVISNEVKNETANTVAEANLLRNTMASSLPIGVILTLLAIWLSYRIVIKPIRHASMVMAEIAYGDSDLRARLPVAGSDEISELANNFNLFIAKITETISSASTSATHLASTSEKLKSTSNNTLSAVVTQEQECDLAVAAMEQIACTVHDIAKNASQASDCSEGAHNNAKESCRIVEENRQAAENISKEILLATSVISDLAEESHKVGGIITVIQGIAEQTNLLALNAAIEAARAGEHGRGFAVVADEVRALSHRTKQATEEIKNLLDGLFTKAETASDVMKSGQTLAVNNVTISSQVQKLIEVVSEETYRISELNLLIATATEEQAKVTDLTRDNLGRISSASSCMAEGARSNSLISVNLEEQAEQQKAVLLQFNV